MTCPSGPVAELDKIIGPDYGRPEEMSMLQSPLDLPVLTSTMVTLPDPVEFRQLTCLLQPQDFRAQGYSMALQIIIVSWPNMHTHGSAYHYWKTHIHPLVAPGHG